MTLLLLSTGPAGAAPPDPTDWDAVLRAARGQTVYWNAWAGESRINEYVAWAAGQVASRHGVSVVHVKLSETADAVARVLAEKAAGKVAGGSVDLIWINGENFAAMKRSGLLFGPWAEALPNFALTDPANNPAVREDFTVPVEGYEAPWGKAQLVLMSDSAYVAEPPRNLPALLDWARANPGRFAYPRPPDFLGSTFLKQATLGLAVDTAPLYRPVDEAGFEAVTAPLWAWLDALHPLLWRGGRAFPPDGPALRRLVGDSELAIAPAFSATEVAAAVLAGELPAGVRTHGLDGGTIGNVNFLAIPFNATAKAGAMVLANFLLSPEAQARKHDPAVWGGETVLAVDRLAAPARALFDGLDLGPAGLHPAAQGAVLPEPHPSWTERLETAWAARYTAR
ncbi:ABC transporter substrate-binding protein [Thalassobaculum sp.]|uniref:ABC transporter substrate-binding protein n=1 Tax=Thalassobaculum sp. TaxID=2022740 RepID=UPI0032EF9CAA